MKANSSIFVFAAVSISLLLWASSFAAIQIALEAYTAGHLALLRFLIASLTLLIYGLITRMPLPALHDIPALGLLGFTGFTIVHIGQNSGQQSVSAGAASFLIASTPIFTALLARIFLREHMNRFGWLGIAISFLGVALISVNTEGGLRFEPGAALILLAALSASIYFVLQKPYLKRYTSLQLTTFTIWAGTLLMGIYAPGLVEAVQAAPPASTLTIVYLGIFATAVGYVLWSYALARARVSTVTSSLNLLPLFSLLIAWLWIGEIPSLPAIIGGILTLIGVLVLNIYGKQSRQSQPAQQTNPSNRSANAYSGLPDPSV